MDLYKIEAVINTGCRGTLTNLTIGGVDRSISYSYQSDPAAPADYYWITKWTNLGLNINTANNVQICFNLDTAGCNTLASFFYNKSYVPGQDVPVGSSTVMNYAYYSGVSVGECCGTGSTPFGSYTRKSRRMGRS